MDHAAHPLQKGADMNSMTMNIPQQIRKGGDLPISRGLYSAAPPAASTTGNGSFAGILNEKKSSAGQDSALPVNPDRGRLQGGSFSDGTPRKEALTQVDPQSAPSGDNDPLETSVSDPAAPETIDKNASSAPTQSAVTAPLNPASPAADAPGKGWGVMARRLGIKPGSPEFHALKGGQSSGDGPGLDGETESPAETKGSADSLGKRISPATDRLFSAGRKNEPAAVMTQNPETTQADAAAPRAASASLNAVGLSDRNGPPYREGASVPPEQPAGQQTAARHGRLGERPSLDRTAANPTPAQNESSPEGMASRMLRTDVFPRNEPATPPFKEASAASARPDHHSATGKIEPKAGTVTSGTAESKGVLTERAVGTKEALASATGQITDGDENRVSGATRIVNATGREAWPLRAEWISTVYAAEADTPVSGSLPAQRAQAVIDQIMDARQTMNSDFGRVRIVLTPPNLGTVDLQVVMRGERVEIIMTADNSSVQQALLARGDDIRSALQRHDLKIEAFQVFLEDHTADQRQAGGGAMFEQNKEQQVKQNFRDSDPVPPSDAPLSINETSKPASGRVSIFA
jgi:flagellar hook-length control protein FliK